jgi:hypothetical protein
MTRRAGVIVLNKVKINPQIPEGVPIPRLKEEASGITEYLWF